MVARLTPDQKVACSIHVGFNVNFLFDGIPVLGAWAKLSAVSPFQFWAVGSGFWKVTGLGWFLS